MTIRITFATLAAISSSAMAQAVPQVAPPIMAPAPKDDLVRVALDTSAGRILVALDAKHAPVTIVKAARVTP